MAADFGRRFKELCEQAIDIESNKSPVKNSPGERYFVNSDDLLNWIVKVRHLIYSVCGDSSQHFLVRTNIERKTTIFDNNYDTFRRSYSILLADKDDYEGGYLNNIRNLIRDDVFDDELEQASELLSAGYFTAAAVVSGVVVETTLRQMCEDNKLGIGKLDKMNADLAKSGVITKLVQKQITAWSDIRNSAAHGKTDQFSNDDVVAMIRDIRKFLTDILS